MEENERVMMESAALVQRAAEDYKRSLLGNKQFLSDQDRVEIEKVHQELMRLQLEMQSVAHERVVVEVLSRPVVQDIEHSRDARIQTKSRYNRDRSSEGTINSAPNMPTSSTNEFIHIPYYVPGHIRGKNGASEGGGIVGTVSSKATVRPVANTTLVPSMRVGQFPAELRNLKTTPIDYTGMPDHQPAHRKRKNVSFEPLAKSLQSKFQATTLEMQRLKEQLAKADTRFNRERNKSMKKLKLIAQSLEDKQGYKDQALLSAVEQLVGEAMDSFRDVVDEVDLLQILEEIVEHIPSAADLFPPAAMAQEGRPDPHAHQRHHHDQHSQDEQRDYTVINVHHPKNHRPKPSTEIIRLPESPQQIPHSEYTVVEPSQQAPVPSQLPAPVAPVSLPVLLPLQPEPRVPDMEKVTIETQTVSLQPEPASLTQPVTIVERPLGMETELVNLLHHVVDAQKAAMQGQQALLLTLVQERAMKEEQEQEQEEEIPPPPPPPLPVVEKEEKAIDTSDLDALMNPPRAVEESEVTEEEPEPVVPYRTAFGQAILGGQSLVAPYTVKAKLPLHHILAQAGLNEQGEAIDGPRQPLARRKAQPLTMQYINQPDYFEEERRKERERQVEEMKQKTEMERMMEFASKLAESMRPLAATQAPLQPVHAPMDRDDIMRVVQEGVSTGVKQALELINGKPSSAQPQQQPTVRRRQMTVEPSERKVLRREAQETKDEEGSLDPQQLRREVEQSRRHVESMKNNRHQLTHNNHDDDEDNLSMDEEFHALYGDRHARDDDEDSERGSSIFSSDEEQNAVFGTTKHHPVAHHSHKAADVSDEVSVSNSMTSDNFKDPEVFSGHGMLPPIYSNVLRHSATREAIDRALLSRQPRQQRKDDDYHDNSDDGDDFFDLLPNSNNFDDDQSFTSRPLQAAESTDFDFGKENGNQASHSNSSNSDSQRSNSHRPKRSDINSARQAALRKVNIRLSSSSMSIDSSSPRAAAISDTKEGDNDDLSSVGELPRRDDDRNVSLNSSVGSFNTSASSADLTNLARVSIPLLNVGRRYGNHNTGRK